MDGWGKLLARTSYSITLGALVLLGRFSGARTNGPHVFYGGALAGDRGGPLVKVKRLREYFPEHRLGYNLVYLLSNAPYLPDMALHLLKKTGTPIIHNQNGVFYPAWYEGDWRAQNKRMARSYHMADRVFYQSEFCKRAADKFLGERDGAGEILYNAVDTQHFSSVKNKSSSVDRPFLFLLTGIIGDHLFYRLESSLRGLAVARRKGLNAQLIIAGGIEDEALRAAHELMSDLALTDAVMFTGRYSQEQAPEVYHAADAYITTKHNDPCPNAVLEALACGLPVLYSNTGGIPELVGDSAGIALECNESWDRPYTPSAENIGEGMLSIAEGHKKMSEEARSRAVQRFDIKGWIARHQQVFNDLLENQQ